MTNAKQITIELPDDMVESIAEYAQANNVTLEEMVAIIVQTYIFPEQ